MSFHRLLLLGVLATAACARSEDVPEEALEAAESEAEALPAAVVEEAVIAAPAAQIAATWQATERGEGTTLRLVSTGDDVLMTLACANVPRELVAVVPGFTRSPSDSRFSLTMGSAPIILVADVATTTEGHGVVARAPLPVNFAVQLGAAKEITAAYGLDTLGPYAAPDVTQARGLLAACGIADADLPPLPKAAVAG